ncbi:hypothetical protein JVU11DRAFT_3036 [Chiua virens]|nr:hypothetical protein JVU11DRAFT_3033 [Chiua virens]KAG9316952.1 hypothetical protein JVU11DRAFT_3036 [Chiua virens]
MPQEWTTKEQKKFLQDELTVFKQIGGRNYTKNWPALYQRWFRKWPERQYALPGVADTISLTAEQTKVLADAIAQRQLQLRRWLHWHAGAGESRSANAKTMKIMDNLLKPKKRTQQPWEVYSKFYYKTRIQPEISKGMSIAEVNWKIRSMFDAESLEIKEEVKRISDDQKMNNLKGCQTDTGPDDVVNIDRIVLRSNIQQCGPALQRVINHLGEKTGWKFTVLMGGPDPLDPQGGNIITTLHARKTKEGLDFVEVYPKFDSEVVDAFGEFLSHVCAVTSEASSMEDRGLDEGEGDQTSDELEGNSNTDSGEGSGEVNGDVDGGDADADGDADANGSDLDIDDDGDDVADIDTLAGKEDG